MYIIHMKIAIAGASGYAGGELLRLLADRQDCQIVSIAAQSYAGKTLISAHPQFTGSPMGEWVFCETVPEALSADLIFLALPHGASGALAQSLIDMYPECKIVDLGPDFRLESSDEWVRYYGGKHAGTWTYGLPEKIGAREVISRSQYVANPGCYATATALAFLPAVSVGIVETQGLTCVAASGTSGAGRGLNENVMATSVMGSLSPYKTGGRHQHIPEIEQTVGAASRLSFTPILAPMPRGILATCIAPLTGDHQSMDAVAVRDIYEQYFAESEFVTVLPSGTLPSTGAVLGSNAVHMSIDIDHHSQQLIVISALDNLVKGAAGQAIQNANLMFGLPEGAGLSTIGVTP